MNREEVIETFQKFRLKVIEAEFQNCYGTFKYSKLLHGLLLKEFPNATIKITSYLLIDIEY